MGCTFIPMFPPISFRMPNTASRQSQDEGSLVEAGTFAELRQTPRHFCNKHLNRLVRK